MTTPVLDHSQFAISGDACAGLHELGAAIDRLQVQGPPTGSRPEVYDAWVVRFDREIRRLQALKLGVVAAADSAEVADHTGMADTSAWLARRTHADPAQASREVRLAAALNANESRPCQQALAAGGISTEHARVILSATNALPSGLSAAAIEIVEQDLVDKAARYAPDQLRRVARRALAVIESDPAVLDRHEDSLLRSEEQAALARTRLTLHDNGDGTTSGHFTVPTFAAAVLSRAVQSMTAPRRARLGAGQDQAGDPTALRDWAHQAGLALVELLEHLPTDRLHRKVAATVVVTIDLDRLRAAVGAAGLDTGDSISAGELRRLACGARLLPAVLGGRSLPLDLGRSSRFFSEAQQVALATCHQTCAAEGCDRPYSWCELHHRIHWSDDGTSNLDDADPLCGFHHRRIHDPDYSHDYGPNGIRFLKRTTRSRT